VHQGCGDSRDANLTECSTKCLSVLQKDKEVVRSTTSSIKLTLI
jgi:predicted nucleic acid-binding Zn ribbon protein